MQPKADIALAVKHFLREATGEGFDTPEGAEGCCEIASRAFVKVLSQFGIPGWAVCLNITKLTHYPIDVEGCIFHYVVETNGWLIDWTARQFDPSAPFPTIIQKQEIR